MLKTLDIAQNAYIGVLAVTNDRFTLVPEQTEDRDLEVFEKTLKTTVYRCNFGGLSLLGSLSAMNSRGLVVPDYVDVDEIKPDDDFTVASQIGVKFNAFGNNILVNDNFALVHQRYDVKTVREIADVLDVETEKGTIAGFRTVGSAAVVTNKGLLVHPLTKPDELDFLKEIFKVPGNIGSANFGVGQVGACLVANSVGAVIGNHSTGIELGRIEDSLEIY